MKIILYTNNLATVGGIETSMYELAKYLRTYHDVHVRYRTISQLQMKRYKEAGIDIQQEKDETCDVLIIGSVWHQPAQIAAKVTVQQIHADWSDAFWCGGASGMQLIKKSEPRADIFAAVSNSAAEFTKRVVNKPVITMNNLAPERFAIERKKNTTLVFGAFTRMTSEKGEANYQAFRKRIIELGIEAEFRVYTPGDAPEGWTKHEPVQDIRTELPSVDYVVSLADTESFGYTIAEANSCGIPCVIKRVNSTEEFFNDKDNLILDDVTAFTKKDLRRKISNYTLRQDTEANIDNAIQLFETMQSSVAILMCKRDFYDIKSKIERRLGSRFTADRTRAEELLSNEHNIVEQL